MTLNNLERPIANRQLFLRP